MLLRYFFSITLLRLILPAARYMPAVATNTTYFFIIFAAMPMMLMLPAAYAAADAYALRLL